MKTKLSSVLAGGRKKMLLLLVMVAAIAVILLFGLITSAASSEGRELVNADVTVRQTSLGIDIFATGPKDDPANTLRYLEFTIDFLNNPLVCDIGNPNHAGLGWQQPSRDESNYSYRGYTTKYTTYYTDVIPLVKEVKRLFDDEPWGPAALDQMVICVKVANREIPGYWLQAARQIHLDPAYFDTLGEIEIAVGKTTTGLRVTFAAYSPDYRTNQWKYTVIDVGEKCGRDNFDHPPNHPGINNSNKLTIPPTDYDAYRNKWICFEATDAGRQTYAFYEIDLGDPVVAVSEEDGFLVATSNENVTWRIGRAKNLILSQSDYYHEYAGNLCEQVFAGSASGSLGNFNSTSDGLDRVRIIEGYAHYCFEATDADGNRTYVEARPNLGIWVNSRIANSYYTPATATVIITPYLTGVSGDVDWTVVGPSAHPFCDNLTFTAKWGLENNPKLSYSDTKSTRTLKHSESLSDLGLGNSRFYRFSFAWPGSLHSKGRYNYCIRATDHLGNHHYRKIDITNYLR